MACGLIRAARPTTSTLMPKNTVTMATPISAPIRPLTPARAADTTTMIAAAAAVSAPARRMMMAYFASILRGSWEVDSNCTDAGARPAFLAGAGRRAVVSERVFGWVYETYHGPLLCRRGA